MADFYPVLSRAINALRDDTPEARRAIYDRAAQVLVAQLRGIDPPLPEAEITRQRLALEEVVARIERERAGLPEPARVPSPVEVRPEVKPEARPELRPDQQPLPEAAPPAPFIAPPTPQPQPKPPVSEAASTVANPQPLQPPVIRPPVEPQTPERPRLDIAPPRRTRAIPWRNLVVAAGVLAAVAGIAVAAYVLNSDNRDSLPQQTAQTQTPRPSAGPKIGERVGAPGEVQPATPTPAQPQPPVTAPAVGQPPRSDVAIAQRAVLYVEPPDPNQQPRPIAGRVSWRVEAQNPGQGQPLETVLRADVEVPEAGLALVFTVRKNFDNAFPASHIVGMRFVRAADDGNGAVREAGVPQFKMEENERGAPLAAITSPLAENLFVSAMSRVPVELDRNLDLLRTRNWIDIPVRFASGRRGIFAFEKGVSGDQRIAEALKAWQ